MSIKGKLAFSVFALSLAALAVGCSGPQPTRNIVVTESVPPTIRSTSTRVPPPLDPTTVPPTAVPLPGATPTEQPPQLTADRTVASSREPTTETVHLAEPTTSLILNTPGPRQVIAPATAPTPTPTPYPTPSPSPTSTPQPTAPATKPSPTSAGEVIIDCIFFDGLVKTTEADEYGQILNQGTVAVELLGWRLVDQSDGTPEFTFPAHRLLPRAAVPVYTNEEHPESGGFPFQRKSSIWNNSNPDTAAPIHPDGTVVSSKSYPPGC